MNLRTLGLAIACAALGWAGYEYSNWRAGMPSPSQALAAAGEASLLSPSNEGSAGRYRISSLAVFSNVTLHIKDNYVDPERIEPREMLVAALEEVEQQVAEVLVERAGPSRVKVRVVDQEKDVFIDEVTTLWSVNLKLREVFRFLERHLPRPEDPRSIEYAAINGALSTLDPHSVLLKPEAFAEMKTSTKGEFGGLGIVISVREGRLTIISPLDGTPASRAGLSAGDVITRIGDVSTVSMSIEEAVQMLRGPEGSKVTIWVDREAWSEARAFEIRRERIKIESVEGELLSDNVGYIQIKNFQQSTGKDLENQLSKLKKAAKGALAGVVLDLRNNPGGLLEQAIRVSDKFVTSGEIVTTVGYGNQLREPKRARWSGTEGKLPLAVLVNKGSASASEIVAGALKNLNRATLIGERTFGKGSVQVLYDFADSSALKLTIAQYLTPGGVSIQSEGVVPDIALRPAWLESDSVRLFYEPEAHRESNLAKHLDRAGNRAFETKPSFEMTYLVEPSEEAQETEDDYLVRFAKDYLLTTHSPNRKHAVSEGLDFLHQRRATEQARIHARLAELGVDWSEGPSPEQPKLQIELSLVDAENGRVMAGNDVRLQARVTNHSSIAVHRLRGVLLSDHPSFKGRELLFGRLLPGETRTWTVETQIPKDIWTRSDEVRLSLSSGDGDVGAEAKLGVYTEMVPRPRFAYSVLVDDQERGDGDGILERGEAVDLDIVVSNLGQGDADEVTVRIKSGAKENLFLERGRAQVGALASGASAVGTLKFRVPENAESAPLPLEVTIYDAGTGEWLEDRFDLEARPMDDVAQEGPAGPWLEIAGGVAIRSGPEADAPVVATIERRARLPALGSAHGYAQVEFVEGGRGFVLESEVREADEGEDDPGQSAVRVIALRSSPAIELDDTIGAWIEAEEVIELKGLIRSSRLRDYYVLLNDEKVYFQPGPETADRDVELPLSVPLALEPGINKILVVARLDEDLFALRSAFVTRTPGAGTPSAVALERSPAEEEAP
jgi:carboxyl-terminal processing protease